MSDDFLASNGFSRYQDAAMGGSDRVYFMEHTSEAGAGSKIATVIHSQDHFLMALIVALRPIQIVPV